jgi:2-oxoglutarate ferredoxin oxidoreductase subunit beta
MGFPLRMSEMLATLDGVSYVVRRAVDDPGDVNRTKKAIKTAFLTQLNGLGFSLVEILSACPVNWNLQPREALCYIKEKMVPYYPLGDYKVIDAVKAL